MGYSLRALKKEVQADLRKARPNPILISLIYLVVSFAVTAWLSRVRTRSVPDPLAILEQVQLHVDRMKDGIIGGQKLAEELLGMSGQFAAFLWECTVFALIIGAVRWTFRYGYQWYCLQVVRGKEHSPLGLLWAFRKWVWVLLAGFLTEIFVALWCLLFLFLGVLGTGAILVFLTGNPWCNRLIVLLWLLLAVWLVSILLGYSAANYILLDEKVDGLDAIGLSKSMMRGRKRHMFVLWASFAGWLALGVLLAAAANGVCSLLSLGSLLPGGEVNEVVARLTGGVTLPDVLVRVFTLPLMAWLSPYLTGAQAKFYDWMKRTDIQNGVWESSRAEQTEAPREKPAKKKKPARASVPAAAPAAQEPEPAPEEPAEIPEEVLEAVFAEAPEEIPAQAPEEVPAQAPQSQQQE